jgi:hypothetical protein
MIRLRNSLGLGDGLKLTLCNISMYGPEVMTDHDISFSLTTEGWDFMNS